MARMTSFESSRRRFLAVSAAAGVGHTLFPGALLGLATAAAAQTPAKPEEEAKLPPITIEMIEQAAALSGLTFTADQRKVMIDGLNNLRSDITDVRKLVLPNSVAPSMVFN